MDKDEKIIIESQLRLDMKDAEAEVKTLEKKLHDLTKQKKALESQGMDTSSVDASIRAVSTSLVGSKTRADQLAESLKKIKEQGKDAGEETKKSFFDLNDTLESIKGKVATTLSLAAAGKFAIQVASVRSQFQQLEVAFTTLLKSEEKANALMDKAVDLAAKTPFDLQGVADGARQLIAYGFSSETVIDDMRRLGDVAAGLGLPLQRLTYLYGTTRVQGRLYARDMLQFTNSGIPMLDELAKMYGVTTAKINEMVSAGKIGFSDVEKVIRRMTDEGGQFANLMEKQSKTIGGLYSNLMDSIDVMFNEIGKSLEGVITGVLKVSGTLVENYKKILSLVEYAIAAYGAYRAALLLTSAVENATSLARVAHVKVLRTLITTQQTLNKVMMANPYAIVAGAMALLVTWAVKYHKKLEEGVLAQEIYNKYSEKQSQIAEKNREENEELIKSIEELSATDGKRLEAMNALIAKYPSILDKYKDEYEALNDIKNIKLMIATIDLENAYNADMNYLQGIDNILSNLNMRKDELKLEMQDSDSADYAIQAYGAIEDEIKKYNQLREEVSKRMSDGRYDSLSNDVPKPIPEEKVNKNYKYWDDKKKELTTKYKEMSDLNTEEAKKLKKEIEEADKELAKWNVSSKTSANKSQKAYDLEQKSLEKNKKLNRAFTDAEFEEEEKRIELMEDGYEKSRALSELNYRKEMETLRRKKEDKLKELQDEQRAEWKITHPEAKDYEFKSNITYESEDFKVWNDLYADMEDIALANWVKANKDAYEKMVNDFGSAKEKMMLIEKDYDARILQAQLAADELPEGEEKEVQLKVVKSLKVEKKKAIASTNNDNVSEFGNNTQKRNAIVAYWEAQMEGAEESLKDGMRLTMEKALQDLDFSEFKNNIDWDSVFGNLGDMGTSTIAENMGKVKQYLDFNRENLGVDQIKDLEEALTKMSDELSSRNPFLAMKLSLEDIAKSKTEVTNAFNEYKVALDEYKASELEYATQKQALDKEREKGEITETEYWEKLNNAAATLTLSQTKLTNATTRLNNAEKKGIVSTKKFLNGFNNARGVLREVTGEVTDLVGVFDEDIADALNDAMELFTLFADTATEVIDIFAEEGKSVVDSLQDTAEGTSEAITKTSEATAAAISAAEAASVILLIIKAAIKAVTMVFSIIKANKEANEASAKAALEYARALEKLNDSARLENLKNAFGEDTYGKFKAYNDQLTEAKKSLESLQRQIKGWKTNNPFAIFMSDFTADMRSGWQKFWGTGQDNVIKANLEDFYDEMGNFDGDKLSEWYEVYGDKLSSGTKDMIESMLAEWDRYKSGMEGVSDYLSDLFNDTAGNIADAMITAFEESGDALVDLTDISKDFAKSMAKSMITSMLLDNIFTPEAQEKIKQMLLNGDAVGASNAYNQLLDKVNATAPEVNEFLKNLNVDWDADTREGETKGIAQASQDSVDELNGRMTAVQGHTYEINDKLSALRENVIEILEGLGILKSQYERLISTSSNILEEVSGIHDDTSHMTDKIDSLTETADSIDKNISWMIDKGVKAL